MLFVLYSESQGCLYCIVNHKVVCIV